jgi:hypothetical protein
VPLDRDMHQSQLVRVEMRNVQYARQYSGESARRFPPSV